MRLLTLSCSCTSCNGSALPGHSGQGRPGVFAPALGWIAAQRKASALTAEAKACNQRAVPVHVFAVQVAEQPPALADKLQKPDSRVVVVPVHLEVLRQVNDAVRENRNLYLG